MLQELTAGKSAHRNIITRVLTPIVKAGASHLLRWKPEGSITVELPTGQKIRFGHASAQGEPHLKLNNYRLLDKALRRGTIGFAEAYMDGDVECSDPTALFRFFLKNVERLEDSSKGLFRTRISDRIGHLTRRNTRGGSRRNISEHYDLGNSFYRLWLDTHMNYSSGYFAGGSVTSLEDAQEAKLDLLLSMLDLSGGEHILEVGCGWGGFARRAAKDHGATVSGVTLSHEQLAHAREQASQEGLSERCDFSLRDYRDVSGHYDHIVSIEMIEAVGEENWPLYFQILNDRLKPQGTAVIQSITINEKRFETYRRKADFIQRYIFPGGMLPTRSRIEYHADQAGLKLERTETFGPCYARTVQHWRQRFEAAWPQISKLGFDEQFRRKWRYYLAYCEAGFLEGMVDVGVYKLRKT
jgi:cyclopropane-fatty-acyl-phospholipid synthase